MSQSATKLNQMETCWGDTTLTAEDGNAEVLHASPGHDADIWTTGSSSISHLMGWAGAARTAVPRQKRIPQFTVLLRVLRALRGGNALLLARQRLISPRRARRTRRRRFFDSGPGNGHAADRLLSPTRKCTVFGVLGAQWPGRAWTPVAMSNCGYQTAWPGRAGFTPVR